MYKYVTLNGDVYVKTEPTFWTKERTLWGVTLVAVASAVVSRLYKKFVR
jgi:hypothetical protein